MLANFCCQARLTRLLPRLSAENLPGTQTIMTQLRLLLLATTTLTAMHFGMTSSHAQTAPLVVAQAKEELGPDGKPKGPPKGAPPPAAAPARPAPPPPPPPA